MPVSRTSILVLFSVLLAGWSGRADAADDGDLLTGYSLTSWNDDEGRPLGSVHAIAQDADGYLWIGTDAGLFRFDGSRFTSWDRLGDAAIPGASARSLWVGTDGSLWVGFSHQAGVGRIHQGTLTRYRAGLDGLDAVSDLVQDARGVMWAIADRRLFALAGDRWAPVALPWKAREGQVFHAYATRQGQLLISTRWGVFRREEGADDFRLVADDLVWGLGEDSQGRIWMTDIAAGFRQLGSAPPSHGLEGGGYRLLHDREGHLWIATFGAGLWRVTREGAAFTVDRAVVRSGLSSDSVLSVLEDRDRNLWVGTTGGLHRLTRRKLTPVDDIGAVLVMAPAPGGELWVGTASGLLRRSLDPERGAPRRMGAAEPDIRNFHTDARGVLWMGTGDGLWRFDGVRLEKVRIPERPQMLVRWLAPDRAGGFWLGDGDWLYHWDGSRLRPLDTPPAFDAVTRIGFAGADRSGRVWTGLTGGRLGFIDGEGTFTAIGPDDGLPAGLHQSINAVFEDGNRVVWIGGSGVSRYAEGRIVTLTSRNGLPEGRVWAIVDDASGDLWLTMDRGIVRLGRGEIERALADGAYRMRYQAYDALDGVAGSAAGVINATRAADGSLWFAQAGGLTHADPQRLVEAIDLVPARVQIAAVVANERRFTPGTDASFPPGTSRLEIQYTAATLTAANKVRFRYRLDGVDTNWVDAATTRTAFYTNLSPREYRFRVEANVEGGSWSAPPAEWRFRIEPLFWQTRWFSALVVIAAAAAVWAAWRARLRLVKRQFSLVLAERARLSREIHDTLLQSLVGVALQVDVVSSSLDRSASPARLQLLRIRSQIEAYIRDARQSIMDLRSPQIEQQDLGAALKEFGRNAVADTSIHFVMSSTGTPTTCPPRVENQLLRVGEEAITNAVRHAHATRIALALEYDERSVTLRVEDNGHGFDYERATTDGNGHYGLRTMRERAEEVGGRLHVTATPGRGTTVEAIVPTSVTASEQMLADL